MTFGTGTTGSRVLNGTYGGHKALEATIADFYGMDHCMVFSTGYQANLGMISAPSAARMTTSSSMPTATPPFMTAAP